MDPIPLIGKPTDVRFKKMVKGGGHRRRLFFKASLLRHGNRRTDINEVTAVGHAVIEHRVYGSLSPQRDVGQGFVGEHITAEKGSPDTRFFSRVLIQQEPYHFISFKGLKSVQQGVLLGNDPVSGTFSQSSDPSIERFRAYGSSDQIQSCRQKKRRAVGHPFPVSHMAREDQYTSTLFQGMQQVLFPLGFHEPLKVFTVHSGHVRKFGKDPAQVPKVFPGKFTGGRAVHAQGQSNIGFRRSAVFPIQGVPGHARCFEQPVLLCALGAFAVHSRLGFAGCFRLAFLAHVQVVGKDGASSLPEFEKVLSKDQAGDKFRGAVGVQIP